MDINGDGLPDHVMAASPISTTNYLAVELSKGPFPDLLSSISNGIGGGMSVTYRPSTQFDNRDSTNALARNLMPFPMQLVASVAVSDGIHSANTTEYSYEGGKWDSERREFDGFAKTVEIDPLGLTSVLWFHQSGGRDHSALGEYSDTADAIAKKGSVFRSELIGTNGQLYKLVLNKIEDADLGDGRHFAFASQTLALDYPGSTNAYRATAKQFFYDLNTGNLTNSIDFGEVTNVDAAAHSFSDVVGDKLYQFTTFATLANADILDKPERSLLTSDSAGQDVLRESLFDYDGNTGNLTQQRDRMCPTCYVTNSFGYDSYNNQTAATNEAGIVTTAVYDSTYQTFPVQQTVGGTFTSGFKYDARSGKLLLSTNAAGLVTATTYDGFFRPLEVSVSTTPNAKPSLWLARYTYQLGMRNGFSTNSVRLRKNDGVDTTNGHETWTYTDGLGRLIQLRDEAETGSYRVTDTAHDERGNIEFQSLPYFDAGTKFGKATTCLGASTEFDPIGRPNKITSAVTGHFTSGRLTSITATGGDSGSPVGPSLIDYNDGNDPWTLVFTDGESKVHKYSLDAFGRTNQIVEVTGGGNFTTSLKYNLAGDLTNIVDHAGNQIEYAYNDLGQMIAMADPDLGVWQYRRDFAGRLREQVDANGQLVRFNYDDPLGRLRSKQVYDYTGAFAYGVTNVYDTSDDANFTVYPGQLYQVIDQEGWQKSGYDVRGRTVRTARYVAKNSATYTNQFGYDAADRLVLNVYPNGGPTITNIFDKGGNLSRVKQVGGAGTTFYTAQGFNNLGQLTGITFGNGVETTYDYYSNSKRLQQTLTAKGTAKLQNLSYTYDKVSNLKSITDGVYTNNDSASLSSLVYDDLHRLTSLTRPAISQTTTFAYDTIGNLTANSENGGGAYNYGTRLPHAVKSANGKNYAYDANGNMLVRGTQRLAYDAENRLVYVVTTNTYSMFGYDAGGSRLWKQSSGTNGLQIWIGGNYEEKNGQILFHITANGQTVCTFDKTGTNVFVYYHADHLHSTSIETDASGARTQHYEYMVFGQDRFTESASAFPVSRRYTSQVLDEDTGLYYYGARYYDPVLGRFIQPDTIIPNLGDPQSLNRYAYARNNPLKHNDPTGHSEDNVVKRVTAPPGVFYAPIHIDAPNVSFSINPNVNIANFPTPIAGPETATIGAPPSHLGDEILRGGGMSQFIGTPIGEHIAGMNAEAILTAPGMEISFAKIGRIIGGTTSSRSMLEGGAYQDLSTAGQVRHHIPAKSVSPLSVGEGPAIRMDPADHMKTASWGRSKAAQGYRAAQETLINQGKFSEAQKMDIQDIISKFGNKYNRGIGQAQKYTETLPPQKLLPLQQSMKK